MKQKYFKNTDFGLIVQPFVHRLLKLRAFLLVNFIATHTLNQQFLYCNIILI